ERSEYEAFIKALPDEYEIFRNPWVPRFRRKDSDLYIDIFVFDYTSNILWKQKMQILRLKFLQGTLKDRVTLDRGGLLGKILSLITFIVGKPFSTDSKVRTYDKIAQKYNTEKTNFIFSSLYQFKYIGHVLRKEIVGDYQRIPFEGTELLLMKGYDSYLSKFYGNYMTPPPKEKRIPEHGNA